jgi:AcrR family transcriptional regulator
MDKREKILTAALKLFVEYGFHGTPTSKIASEAGVSNGTLFHYFKTKEDLILALYDDAKSELNDYLHLAVDSIKDIEEKAKTLIAQTTHWAMTNPQKFYYIQQIYFSPYAEQVPLEKTQKYMQLHVELIENGQKAGFLKALPMNFVVSIVSSHIFGIYQYLQHNPNENAQNTIDKGIEMIWDMITV